MNVKKLGAVLILACMLTLQNSSFALNAKKSPVKAKPLKATVSDYKIEYINQSWWDKYNDPLLSAYVAKAADANFDLKIATLRVSEYNQLVKEYFGKEFPMIGIKSNAMSLDISEDTLSMGDIKGLELGLVSVPLGVSYEVDLWGKNKAKTLSKKKELEAQKYNERAAYISITSATAATYLNVVKADKIISLQKEMVALKKDRLEMLKEKNNFGLCPYIDVIEADKAYTESQNVLADYEKQLNVSLNQLAILTGKSTDDAASLERGSFDTLNIISNIPKDFKSDVVMNRPDILKSEAQLQKAKIDINLARKDFLPSITLSGQLGFSADSFKQAINWKNYMGSVGIAESIFTGGQRIARLKTQKIRYQEMLEDYQKTVLVSFQEVNNSLFALKTSSKKYANNTKSLNYEKDILNRMKSKYEIGAMSQLAMLDYKDKVLKAQKEELQSKSDILVDSISVYKAVGGKM